VRPGSAGTCTLHEAPSFAWRTNAPRSAAAGSGSEARADAGGGRLQCRVRFPSSVLKLFEELVIDLVCRSGNQSKLSLL
jgi:hypothetical protein